MMKILVAEKLTFHEECLPAWISALNRLGIVPDVLYNADSLKKKGNLLEMYPDLVYGRVMLWEPGVTKLDELVEEINAADYEFVLANSFELACSEFYFRLTASILAVVHASARLSDANRQRCEKINARLSGRKIFLVFLWEFIARSFRYQFPAFDQRYIQVMHPLAYLRSFTQNATAVKRCKIAVPGAINFNNRDYQLLVGALKTCKNETLEMIEVVLPGAASAESLETMTALLKEADLEAVFSIPTLAHANRKSRSAYHDYYNHICDATVIMPLFKTASKYRSVSMSSTVATAYCMNVPVALNSSDSLIYDIPYALINQYDYTAALNRLVSDDFQMKREHLKIQQASSMSALLAKNVETLRDCLLVMH